MFLKKIKSDKSDKADLPFNFIEKYVWEEILELRL